MATQPIYRFDRFTLDVGLRRVRRGDAELALEPKTFRLLQFLIEHREQVQSKEEIFREVWQETSVSDNALTRAVAQIRKVLEDDPREPRFIETVPRMGYRFIGQLTGKEAEAALPAAALPLPVWPAPAMLVPALPVPAAWRRASAWILLAVALVAGLALLVWRVRPRPVLAGGYAPVPLTTYRGSEESPTFSPDGSQVAFAWDGEKQDNFDIYVKGLGPNATPLRLTADARPDRTPAWSPDGRLIAFLRIVGPDQGELMVVPASGGVERNVAPVAVCTHVCVGTPIWSADSEAILLPVRLQQHLALFRVLLSTGEATQITFPDSNLDDEAPTLSPDGRTLMFVRHPTYYWWGSLWTIPLDEHALPAGKPVKVQVPGLQINEARFLPQGDDVLAHTPAGIYRVSLMEPTEPKLMPSFGADTRWLAVSARGDRIAYAVLGGDANIWRLDLTARTMKPERVVASTYRDVYPQFSPDGRQLAFYSNRTETGFSQNCAQAQVWVEDLGSETSRQLTFVKTGIAGTPHWSPDGRRLTFDSNQTGRYQVNLISAEGGGSRQLTAGNVDNFGATWSPDGQWLYFVSARTGQDEIFRMPVTGGEPVQVTHAGGWFPVVSADGRTLYFGKSAGSGSVWSMPIEGGTETKLFESVFRGNYAVGALGIYFMTHPGEDGTSELAFYSFASRKPATIWKMGHPEFGLALSPDQRSLLFAQLDAPASDLMLVENFH